MSLITNCALDGKSTRELSGLSLYRGANELVGADKGKIIEAARHNIGRVVRDEKQIYGGGLVANRIADVLKEVLSVI